MAPPPPPSACHTVEAMQLPDHCAMCMVVLILGALVVVVGICAGLLFVLSRCRRKKEHNPEALNDPIGPGVDTAC